MDFKTRFYNTKFWASEYTSFGDKHSIEGELERAAKFTGKDLDEDTGLYYFNARWYDSEAGISRIFEKVVAVSVFWFRGGKIDFL